MTKKYDYRGYTVIKNQYAGYDAVYRLNTYLTLATSPKEWIDLQIEYFNHRVYNRVEV